MPLFHPDPIWLGWVRLVSANLLPQLCAADHTPLPPSLLPHSIHSHASIAPQQPCLHAPSVLMLCCAALTAAGELQASTKTEIALQQSIDDFFAAIMNPAKQPHQQQHGGGGALSPRPPQQASRLHSGQFQMMTTPCALLLTPALLLLNQRSPLVLHWLSHAMSVAASHGPLGFTSPLFAPPARSCHPVMQSSPGRRSGCPSACVDRADDPRIQMAYGCIPAHSMQQANFLPCLACRAMSGDDHRVRCRCNGYVRRWPTSSSAAACACPATCSSTAFRLDS